ncbi:hypothetical protein NM208_g14980 [Fusarium decemcellulare]|uniref:Uncharacterized protein n=1 Tax=Fusarium decemcellulare TaxID=57161 RepID=A0ACC1REU4_9HYPO|nr:hypothetical protein NM208_g14980 [Fusarium decemcellulare]
MRDAPTWSLRHLTSRPETRPTVAHVSSSIERHGLYSLDKGKSSRAAPWPVLPHLQGSVPAEKLNSPSGAAWSYEFHRPIVVLLRYSSAEKTLHLAWTATTRWNSVANACLRLPVVGPGAS